ncbi:hypothetical protein ACIA78_39440 [Streptomyces xanthochromogenes]|uniref:hypothetical protein n=1 Tax=Streptomyces xanthochromogenes TaxID=67384 RepID=UPI00379E1E6F
METGMVTATWSADLGDPRTVATVIADVRGALEREITAARADFLRAMDPHDQSTETASALAYVSFHTVQQALAEHQRWALKMLGQTEKAEAEAQRAFKTEQDRPWFQYNPTGEAAVTAATMAADTARERVAESLLTARLEQLREQAADRAENAAAVPWAARLSKLAARPLDDDTTW